MIQCKSVWSQKAKGAFTIYVYSARWVGGPNSEKFVNFDSIKIVNEGRWDGQKFVKIC